MQYVKLNSIALMTVQWALTYYAHIFAHFTFRLFSHFLPIIFLFNAPTFLKHTDEKHTFSNMNYMQT